MPKSKIKFTGERMIPDLNQGETFYYEHITRYFFATQFVKHKTVLDLGCGTGYGSSILMNTGSPIKVIGVDISTEAIDYAQHRYEKYIKFIVGDIRDLKRIKTHSIDIVTCFEVIEHVKEQEQVLKEIKRILIKDGLLIISTPNVINYTAGNKFHLKELDPEEFKSILKTNFKNVKLLQQNFLFSNEITTENNEKDTKLHENIQSKKQLNYKIPKKNSDCEYLVALCSSSKIPKYYEIALTTDKVGSLSMEQGMQSLSKQISDIYLAHQQKTEQLLIKEAQLVDLQRQLEVAKNKLNLVNNSKV